MITRFFVYGTLKRGQCRENLWPAKPRSVLPARTRGQLFDRSDYPAMTAGSEQVWGECWQFEPTEIAEVIHTLDRIEGTNQPGEADLYVRREVQIWTGRDERLEEAWTYLYATDPIADGFLPIAPPAAWPPAS